MTEPVKVFIPGESPWALPIKTELPFMQARIDNHPVNTAQHGIEYGDVVTFIRATNGDFEWWELAREDQQLPVGPQELDGEV